jgi:hypothetical protein
LRTFAVINQTAIFFTGQGKLPRPTRILACTGKETQPKIKGMLGSLATGFFTIHGDMNGAKELRRNRVT